MTHPYPPHWAQFSYIGKYQYSLTFVTDGRRRVFVDAATVDFVLRHILRAATEQRFAVIVYCFMPDHLHMLVDGEDTRADGKAFIKAAKQYAGYYYSQARRSRLWDRYGFERVIRDEIELALTIRYIVANPVRAGLAKHPRNYPFLGSTRCSVDELLRWCEYSDAVI